MAACTYTHLDQRNAGCKGPVSISPKTKQSPVTGRNVHRMKPFDSRNASISVGGSGGLVCACPGKFYHGVWFTELMPAVREVAGSGIWIR